MSPRSPNLGSAVPTEAPFWAPPVLAVQFLTRLPVGSTTSLSPEQVRDGLVRAVAWFPLIGTLIGGITAGVAVGSATVWPPIIAVILALAVEVLVTGAFHEDAVADFCDGFGGGLTGDDVRRIMKDSRIGTYGAAALILAIGLRAALTLALLETRPPVAAALAIVAAATFGRWLIVVVMVSVPPAPAAAGLAKDIGAVGSGRLALASLAALPGTLGFGLCAPRAALATLVAATVFVVCFRRLLRRRIGGSTGDCLGFAAYAGQLLLLLAANAT